MGTTTGLKLLVTALMVMELYPNAESQRWVARPPPLPTIIAPPLCASQITLVNHACAQLPYMVVPPPSPPSPPSEPPTPVPAPPKPPAPMPAPPVPPTPAPVPPTPKPIPSTPPPVPPTPTPVPPTPTPVPPSPPSPDSPDDHRRQHHRHHHHHSPSHGGSDDSNHLERFRLMDDDTDTDTDTLSATQAECCKWLKEVDNVCVCDVLVHLPVFLTRPIHNYTVFVDESCQVTFSCGSRLVQV